MTTGPEAKRYGRRKGPLRRSAGPGPEEGRGRSPDPSSQTLLPGRLGPPPGRPQVLLDANALMLPFNHRFPLEREIFRVMEGAQIRVPSSVVGELERLADFGVFPARAAREFAKRFPVVPTDLRGDAALETLARDLDAWIVTGDRELRRRLEARNLKVLFPRGMTRLEPSRHSRGSTEG